MSRSCWWTRCENQFWPPLLPLGARSEVLQMLWPLSDQDGVSPGGLVSRWDTDTLRWLHYNGPTPQPTQAYFLSSTCKTKQKVLFIQELQAPLNPNQSICFWKPFHNKCQQAKTGHGSFTSTYQSTWRRFLTSGRTWEQWAILISGCGLETICTEAGVTTSKGLEYKNVKEEATRINSDKLWIPNTNHGCNKLLCLQGAILGFFKKYISLIIWSPIYNLI